MGRRVTFLFIFDFDLVAALFTKQKCFFFGRLSWFTEGVVGTRYPVLGNTGGNGCQVGLKLCTIAARAFYRLTHDWVPTTYYCQLVVAAGEGGAGEGGSKAKRAWRDGEGGRGVFGSTTCCK